MALSYTDQLCYITGSNTTFWGSEFSMELIILFVLALMRQNIYKNRVKLATFKISYLN